jgi:imidazolonepropionase-like amidohydrolase
MKSAILGAAFVLATLTPAHAFQTYDGKPVGNIAPPGMELPKRGEPVAPETHVAILSSKILTCAEEGPEVINNGVLLIDGRTIRAVGKQGELEIPDGFEVIDAGDNWVMPGLIDLHSHIGGSMDINDTVFLTNPGLRAYTSVVPRNANLMRALASGVTSILLIPGSGTNISGQGVLIKTGLEHYEDMEIRNPGTMKLAQAGNPERFAFGVNRSFMNWHTRETISRGVTYAKSWQDYAAGKGPKPELNIQFELFRWLVPKISQISAHTQIYQVVLESLDMLVEEFDLPLFIDHGTIGAWKLAPLVKELGVAAQLGPRNVDPPARGFIYWSQNMYAEGWNGTAAGYQKAGVTEIGFNTDAPVMPQEELQLQAGVAVHFGFNDDVMQTIKGLTIIPARIANMNDRIGSLEVGKEADVLILTGHPADVRTSIERVWIEGTEVYNAEERRDY